jgi:Co/Zn/Cd efflux system component
MGACCDTECGLQPVAAQQRRTLWLVLMINAVMFAVIVAAALISRSTSLLADSIDNLGDAVTYGLSLLAVGGTLAAKARVSVFKGSLILFAAAFVGVQIIYRLFNPAVPVFEMMTGFAVLGLAANCLCLYLLWRHRNEDINMNSVWECSRNDIASNLSVIFAGVGVWVFGSGIPDLIVASLLFIILIRSAFRVLGSSLSQLRSVSTGSA